jgi:hypothetical protein
MSVDIFATNGESFDVNNVGWRFILEFGRHNGWIPCGTTQPLEYVEANAWDGSYDPAMGQFVLANDATSLGEAIARGLKDSNLSGILSAVTERLTEHAGSLGFEGGPAARVTDKTIRMLWQFVEVARNSGGFRIE